MIEGSEVPVAVGIDVAKELHWVRTIGSERSELPIDRCVDNKPAALQALIDEREALRGEHGALRVGIDAVGGISSLLAAIIAEGGSIERFPTADRLAAASGHAPVLKPSGKIRYLKRARGVNKTLKRVFFQSAFCLLSHRASNAFYTRKRAERKSHDQAVIALTRRRIDVLHAMVRNRTPYEFSHAKAA